MIKESDLEKIKGVVDAACKIHIRLGGAAVARGMIVGNDDTNRMIKQGSFYDLTGFCGGTVDGAFVFPDANNLLGRIKIKDHQSFFGFGSDF